MTSRDKAATVIVMWLVGTGLSLALLIGRPFDWPVAITMISLLGCIVGGSIAIAIGVNTTQPVEREKRPISLTNKPKNSDSALVDRLIESMSDEELASLRRRLTEGNTGDDGEIMTLEDAVQQTHRR